MKERKLKIGILAPGFGEGTGPASYLAALREALGREHELALDEPWREDLDLIHVVDAKRLNVQTLAFVKLPVILDFHDDYWVRFRDYPAPDRLLRRLRQKQLYLHHTAVLKLARAVIAHSEAVADSLTEVLAKEKIACPAHLVHYRPGPAFLSALSAPPPEFRPSREPLILMVGRDLFRKGFPTLAAALPTVLQSCPGARVVVIGREYFHARLAAKWKARGLPIEFRDQAPPERLAEWYRRAAVLVLPSFEEAFGMVLIEAMAMGLPVVAARVGGIPEAVEDNVSGLLHAPGDAADLAPKLISALTDQALRDRLIAAGRARAGTFSPLRLSQELSRAYLAVLESR